MDQVGVPDVHARQLRSLAEGASPLVEQLDQALHLGLLVLTQGADGAGVEAQPQPRIGPCQAPDELRLQLVGQEVQERQDRDLPEGAERLLGAGVVEPLGQADDGLGHAEDGHDRLAVPGPHLTELHLARGEADLLVAGALGQHGSLPVAVGPLMGLPPGTADGTAVGIRQVAFHAQDATGAATVGEQRLVVAVQDEVLGSRAIGRLHRAHAPQRVVGVGIRDLHDAACVDLHLALLGGHAPGAGQLRAVVNDLLNQVSTHRPQLIRHTQPVHRLYGAHHTVLLHHHDEEGFAVQLLGLSDGLQPLALAHQRIGHGQQLHQGARLDGLVVAVSVLALHTQGHAADGTGDGRHAGVDPGVLGVGAGEVVLARHVHHQPVAEAPVLAVGIQLLRGIGGATPAERVRLVVAALVGGAGYLHANRMPWAWRFV